VGEETITVSGSKFPVYTENGEYKVDVRSSYATLGMYQMVVTVYIENQKRGIFRRRFKKVRKISTSWDNYRYWLENTVELAEKAVKKYEEEIAEDIRHRKAVKESIAQFDNWDGIINESEDE